MSCFLVNGLEHAFPGCFLHHAGGEETTENAKFTLPKRLCGPARPPYNCQKHMGATQPQREMKSWRSINDKWMHWVNSGCRGELVCVCVCVLVSFGDLGIAIYILTLAHTSFLWKVLRKWCKGGLNEVMWIRWMLTCVCFYILHQWLDGVTGRGGILIGLLQNGLTEGIVASVA